MSMRKNKALAAIFALVLSPAAATVATVTLVTQPGCFLFGSPGPSAVGQGHRYASGDPTFDAFFETLHDLQVRMAEAPGEEQKIRHSLATELDADPDASATILADKTGTRAHALAAKGIGLKLETEEGDDETKAKAELHAVGAALGGDEKTFVDAVQTAVQKELELAREMKKAKKTLEQFRASMADLDAKVDATFRLGGPRKKAEVRKNLDDAQRLIPLMNARADEVHDAALATAKKLSEAVETSASAESRPAPPAEPEQTRKTKHTQRRPRPKSSGASHAPSSKPKSKPEPKPAPKPAPKPPPSDFEP